MQISPAQYVTGPKVASMSSRFSALVLLCVLFWQLMSAFGALAIAQRADELEHMVMHAQDVHHHADLTLHMDDAAVEMDHLHPDSTSIAVALMQSMQSTVASYRSLSAPESIHSMWLAPTLEGPLRPPSQSA